MNGENMSWDCIHYERDWEWERMEEKGGRAVNQRPIVNKNICVVFIFNIIKYRIRYVMRRTELLVVLPNIKLKIVKIKHLYFSKQFGFAIAALFTPFPFSPHFLFVRHSTISYLINANTKYSETAYLWRNRINRNSADFCTFRCIVWIYLIMFALRCRHYAITHGLQRLFTTALFARHPFQRFASTTSKPTEQLDIDKKNGVLAYIPFGSDFELSPIMGKMEFTTRITNR